jgi:hypothetical protein
MNESSGLSVVALNEAETLHRVEELDRSAGFLAGQLTLWPAAVATRRTAKAATARAIAAAGTIAAAATAAHDFHGIAVDPQVGRRDSAAAIDERELERLAVGQIGQAGLLDCGNVHEHILAAVIANDEAEAFLRIEEFDDALAFANDLGRHSATSAATGTAAAETTAAATATAEATAAAATVAATVATATAAAAISAAAAEAARGTAGIITAAAAATAIGEAAALTACRTFFCENSVALVAPTTAAVAFTPFIETHARPNFLVPNNQKTTALGS